MVKMVPDFISENVKSDAEKKLFQKFKDYKTENDYIILHSLGMAEHCDKIFGEIDFVVICGEGILCIEVKGGKVCRKDGAWQFINRKGKKTTKKEGPFHQAEGNMFSLLDYIKNQLHDTNDTLVNCQYACCVIMPECSFDYTGPDIIQEILFDNRHEIDLDRVVEKSFAYWRRKLGEKNKNARHGLNKNDMNSYENILRGDLGWIPGMKAVVTNNFNALKELTAEQYRVIDGMYRNERLLISGPGGTGKTMIAIDTAKNKFYSGKRVLYVCFNKGIASYVQYIFNQNEVDVQARTLHSILKECATSDKNLSNEDFEKNLPQNFLEKSDVEEYDYLIVDEGQDLFTDAYIQCLNRMLKGGLKKGSWMMLYDENQNIFNDNKQFEKVLNYLGELSSGYDLTENCRNTWEINEANKQLTRIKNVGVCKVRGGIVKYCSYKDIEDESQKLVDVLKELKNEHIKNNDLVLLSRYKADNKSRSCLPFSGIDFIDLKESQWKWPASKSKIQFSTISSFKGLEANVVILLDVDDLTSQPKSRLRNYVAISRACSVLYVFYDEKLEEERQNLMIMD